ncbi:sensor histidine kinase [Georgenia sp. Z1491]|uniref:sensor histidine kinase n=1 Tax=Georgenia sp. Z1491 TaxID=3416707 RepID=UPI003CEB7C37
MTSSPADFSGARGVPRDGGADGADADAGRDDPGVGGAGVPRPDPLPAAPPVADTARAEVRQKWWRRAAPYVFAGGWTILGILGSLFVWIALAPSTGASRTAFVVELGVGLLCFGLLYVRKRWPRTVTLTVTVLASTLSFSSMGALIVVLVSYAARPIEQGRRLRRYVFFGVVLLVVVVGGMFYDYVTQTYVTAPAQSEPGSMIAGTQDAEPIIASTTGVVSSIVVSALLVGFCLAVGSYIGARRALLAELQTRARRAEAVVEASTERARTAERNRIAREMHDVLAHRISLVALHSGALSHRTDLPPEAVREAADVISSNAQLALTELRQVLGVLRADNGRTGREGAGHREPPQPTMTAVDGLFTDARQVGMRVRVSVIGIGAVPLPPAQALISGTGVDDVLATLSPTVSRTAYRILQEALTNARKHAPDGVVDVELSGRLGKVLTVAVTNPMPFPGQVDPGRADGESLGGVVGSGSGLAGLAERTDLAGGTLDHGVEPDGFGRTIFAVRAWLPWDESVGGWRGRGGG